MKIKSFHTNNDRKKKQKVNDNYILGLNKYEEVDFDKLIFFFTYLKTLALQ